MRKLLSFLSAVSVCALATTVQAQTNSTEDLVPGRVLIDQDDDISEADSQRLMDDLRAQFPEIQIESSGILESQTKIEVAYVYPENAEKLVSYLRGHQGVHQAELSYLYYATWEPNDPEYSKQWGLPNAGAPEAWNYTQGQGAVVAVVDTGVGCEDRGGFRRLSDLADTHCLPGWNFVSDNDLAADDQGHGSHVAGTVAQSTNNGLGTAGMAFKASILPVKVLSRSGSGTAEDVASGIRWACDNGANIINLSLGSSHPSGIEKEAIDEVYAKGCTVIAAAGNDGPNNNTVGYPASFPHVIAVSAINDQNLIANFSSRGPQVDIAAPGAGILQQTICNHGEDGCEQYVAWNGTSMATPHVAGAAALLYSLGVTHPDAIEKALRDSATTNDTTKKRPHEYGSGILNIAQAVKNVVWKQGLTRLTLGLFWVWALLFSLRKKEHLSVKNWKFLVPAGLLGVGLFFLPKLFPMMGPLFHLSRPLLELDGWVTGSFHQYLPLATSLVPAGLTALAYHRGVWRQAVAGVATGIGVYLGSVLYLGQHFNAWGQWFSLWMFVNMSACFFLAQVNLLKVRDEHADEQPQA